VGIGSTSGDSFVKFTLGEREVGRGSIQDIQRALEEVRNAYPETGKGEWGDLRINFAELVKLERDEQYSERFQLKMEGNQLTVLLRGKRS